MAMARGITIVALLVVARSEPEECPLLQVRKEAANATKEEGNVPTRKIPSGPTDDLHQLSPEEWAISVRGLECASSTYRSQEDVKQCGKVVKEVEGRAADGSDFMMARVMRSDDGKCWVAFRGTANDKGWEANFNSIKKQEHFSKHNILVASSWLHCYKLLREPLKKAIEEAYASGDCHPQQMYYTGHSLGGVLANYAALDDLAGADGYQASYIITAGCPRPWTLTGRRCRRAFP